MKEDYTTCKLCGFGGGHTPLLGAFECRNRLCQLYSPEQEAVFRTEAGKEDTDPWIDLSAIKKAAADLVQIFLLNGKAECVTLYGEEGRCSAEVAYALGILGVPELKSYFMLPMFDECKAGRKAMGTWTTDVGMVGVYIMNGKLDGDKPCFRVYVRKV